MADNGTIIDELPSLPNAATNGDEIPIERGQNTFKVEANALANVFSQRSMISVFCGTVDELPLTVEDARITSNMQVVGCQLTNMSAVSTAGWTVTTADGSLTITGTLEGTTDMILYLAINSDELAPSEDPAIDPYTGNYIVTPSVESQSMSTAGYYMTDNVTIRPIPYYLTPNAQGGYTAVIGG